MGRIIDLSNYRAACAPLIMEFRRFSDSPLRAGMAEGVANILWQFGDPEADEWFRRALEVYGSSPAHRLKVLLALWKMGSTDGLAETGMDIVRDAESTLRATPPSRSEQAKAHYDRIISLVLVGAYERAVVAIDEADSAAVEHRPYVLPALRAVTRFGLTGDTTSLEQAVQHLRTQMDEWPTDGIALHHDVMRVAERLGGVAAP